MNRFIENLVHCDAMNDLTLYYCGHREKSLKHRYGPHRFNTYLLSLVEEGEADLVVNGVHHTLKAGDFYVMFPYADAHYTTKPDVPWSIRWVVVGGNAVAPFLSSLQITETQPMITAKRPDKMRNILTDLLKYSSSKNPSDKLRCISLLYRLFSLLTEQMMPATTENPYVLQAIAYFGEHFTKSISLQDYAKSLGLNNNYFSKLFKAETGTTPLRYINGLRFEKAEYLLTNSSYSVDEIAEIVGIGDTLYFSRAFKQHTGMSPSAFRKLTVQ